MSFQPPRLLQRLNPPTPGTLSFTDSGLGFNKKTLFQLNHFFSFDYMGASEFEYGALPRAFSKFEKHYSSGKMTKLSTCVETIPDNFIREIRDCEPKYQTVYLVAPSSYMDDLQNFIESEAAGIRSSLKEPSKFQSTVFNKETEERRGYSNADHVGWFDLDNGCMFFIDKNVFENFTNAIERYVNQNQPKKSKPIAAARAKPA